MNPFARAFGVEYEFETDSNSSYDPEFFREILEGEWSCHFDNSEIIECASPITKFGVNHHIHDDATAAFQDYGYPAHPSEGGMHVHIDLRDMYSVAGFAKLRLAVAVFEPVLMMMVDRERLFSSWCSPRGMQLIKPIFMNQKLQHSRAEALYTDIYKYSVTINPEQLFRIGHRTVGKKHLPVYTHQPRGRKTIEFRMHESCIDWDVAQRWIRLLQILVQEGKSQRGIREQRLWTLLQTPYRTRIRALAELVRPYDKTLCPYVEHAYDRETDTVFMAELYRRINRNNEESEMS